MSDLHDLCRFQARPVTDEYITSLKEYLRCGIPATYTVEDAVNYENGIEEEASSTTTPLHLICQNLPQDASTEELSVIEKMVEILLEYGAGWCLADVNNDTPGCILNKRNLSHLPIYDQIVAAGVRAELLLRKVGEYDMEVIDDTDDLDHERFGEQNEKEDTLKEVNSDDNPEVVNKINPEVNETNPEEVKETNPEEVKESIQKEVIPNDLEKTQVDLKDDAAEHQSTYLATKLEYTDDALVTQNNKDGVMMLWETNLMRLGCESLFKGGIVDGEPDAEVNILNIGFGMGIIDRMIQEKKPTKHYICEAHPDVLAKMRQDGWYDKKNVVVLEGRWQTQLDQLLSLGEVFFNGIYYDTFSEHYLDMLELFDYVVGLLKPHGVFLFFNGLGADRKVVYDVYRQLLEIDLGNYGLKCSFDEVKVPENTLKRGDGSVWDDVKRSYWECPAYYHPEARFFD